MMVNTLFSHEEIENVYHKSCHSLTTQMVNTFVTYPVDDGPHPYEKTARSIDPVRLNKQIIEASQINDILDGFRGIHETFFPDRQIPMFQPDDDNHTLAEKFLQRGVIFKEIYKEYLKGTQRLVRLRKESNIDARVSWVYEVTDKCDRQKISSSDDYSISNDGLVTVRFAGRKREGTYEFERDDVLLPDERVVGKSFCYHPCVQMWFGYENALRVYINDCLYVWKSGTNKNGSVRTHSIPEYPISGDIVHPWWLSKTTAVILSHRVNLLRKERARSETPWYWKIPDFTYSTQTPKLQKWFLAVGYIWTNNLTIGQIVSLLDGKWPVSPCEISDRIALDQAKWLTSCPHPLQI